MEINQLIQILSKSLDVVSFTTCLVFYLTLVKHSEEYNNVGHYSDFFLKLGVTIVVVFSGYALLKKTTNDEMYDIMQKVGWNIIIIWGYVIYYLKNKYAKKR